MDFDPKVAESRTSSNLLTPLRFRDIELKNRIVVAPMCQYSSKDGMANNWHLVHLGSRAVGGAGVVMTEATAVSPEARITSGCLGIWSDAHADALAPIAEFISAHGAVPAIQLAHAGRRAARTVPWDPAGALPQETTWDVAGPSPIAFDEGWQTPAELSADDLEAIVGQFAAAALRALDAGFKIAELHMAHGYLLHTFLSPLTNKREDAFGGDLRRRAEFPLRVAKAVRSIWPENLPLFARMSTVDWVPEGLTLEDAVQISRWLKEAGVDLIDCSSGFAVPREKIPHGHPFQVPFAAAIRKEAGIATGAVGFILEPEEAEKILAEGHADLIIVGRGMLNDPYWAHHAAAALGTTPNWPIQYARAVRHFHDKGWRPNALGLGQAKSA